MSLEFAFHANLLSRALGVTLSWDRICRLLRQLSCTSDGIVRTFLPWSVVYQCVGPDALQLPRELRNDLVAVSLEKGTTLTLVCGVVQDPLTMSIMYLPFERFLALYRLESAKDLQSTLLGVAHIGGRSIPSYIHVSPKLVAQLAVAEWSLSDFLMSVDAVVKSSGMTRFEYLHAHGLHTKYAVDEFLLAYCQSASAARRSTLAVNNEGAEETKRADAGDDGDDGDEGDDSASDSDADADADAEDDAALASFEQMISSILPMFGNVMSQATGNDDADAVAPLPSTGTPADRGDGDDGDDGNA